MNARGSCAVAVVDSSIDRPQERGGPARRRDRGSVTAELAVALPAVGLVLAICVSGLRLASDQVRLQDAAGIAARALARGDPVPGGVEVATVERRDGLVCVAVRSAMLAADACALGGGG